MSSTPQGWRHAFDGVHHGLASERLLRQAWIALAATLVMGLISMAHLAFLEFGPWRHRAIQVDELYFAACAARGTAVGESLVAGCHDSKAPMIYILYQWVQGSGAPYDLVAVKVAALSTVAIILVLVGAIALRMAGLAAAIAAPALLIQALSGDASVMAFKTDTVGAAFMLAGLYVLMGEDARQRLFKVLAAGLLLGLAVVTKQSFGFFALAVLVWLAVARGSDRGAVPALRRIAVFGAGAVLPFLVFLGLFKARGRDIDYLASFFLYPSVYGESPLFSLEALFWRLSNVLDILSHSTILVVLFTFAALSLAIGALRGHPVPARAVLLLFATVAAIVVVMVAPTYFPYHTVPLWTLTAILGGTSVGEIWSRSRARAPTVTVYLAGGLLIAAVLSAASSWHTNGGRRDTSLARDDTPSVEGGGYAYVLGTWPDFYVYNRLVPASDIMFPWALPGTPASWTYNPPGPGTLRDRMLEEVHARNLSRLFADFDRTPPGYILVLDDMAREAGSSRVTDVQGFDEYLEHRCTFVRTAHDERRGSARLFRCNVEGTGVAGR